MKAKTIGYGVLMPVAPRCVITGEDLGRRVLESIQDSLPRFGDSSDMWLDDADRAQRCWEAAEDGGRLSLTLSPRNSKDKPMHTIHDTHKIRPNSMVRIVKPRDPADAGTCIGI